MARAAGEAGNGGGYYGQCGTHQDRLALLEEASRIAASAAAAAAVAAMGGMGGMGGRPVGMAVGAWDSPMPETVNNPQSMAGGAPPHGADDEVLPMVVATGSSDIPTRVKAVKATPVATIIGEGGGGFAPPPATAVTATGAPGKAWGAAPGGDGGDGKEGQIRMIASEECAVVALSEGEGETKLSSFDSNDGGDDDDDDDDDALYAEGDGALVLLGDAGSEDECGESTEDSSLAMTHSSFGKCPYAECLY